MTADNEVNQFKHEVVQQLGETIRDDQQRWLTEIFEGEPITTLTLVMLGGLDLALIIALIGALNRGGSASNIMACAWFSGGTAFRR